MPDNDREIAQHTIRTFAAATFLNDLGSNMIYPIWPLFVTQVLKANMVAMGFLDGLGEGLLSISKAFSGYLSDRLHKRKVFIWLGYLLSVLARLGYAAASVWQHLIVFRILDRIGKERSAPRDALVADVSDTSNRGTNFGFIRAMDHLGALLGSLLVIALIGILGYRWIFALAALPTLASAGLVFYLIKERPSSDSGEKGAKPLSLLGKDFRLVVLFSSVFAFGAFSYSFLLLYARDIGFSTPLVVSLYPLFTAVASLTSWISGRLSDRVGRKPVLVLSYSLWAAVCLAFIVFRHPLIIIGSFVLFGAHKGILIPVQRTIVSECSPPDLRASGLGLFHMITGLCALPASFLAGILWEVFGKTAPFAVSLGLSSAALLICILFFRPGPWAD